MKACDKLMSLELQDPLMKVLAGLEYVLKKAQVMWLLAVALAVCVCGHVDQH